MLMFIGVNSLIPQVFSMIMTKNLNLTSKVIFFPKLYSVVNNYNGIGVGTGGGSGGGRRYLFGPPIFYNRTNLQF